MIQLNNQTIVIGIDHGYGNIKTAHTCFKAGVTAYDKEPTFKNNMLIYNDKYYIIGEEHKEFISDTCHNRTRLEGVLTQQRCN